MSLNGGVEVHDGRVITVHKQPRIYLATACTYPGWWRPVILLRLKPCACFKPRAHLAVPLPSNRTLLPSFAVPLVPIRRAFPNPRDFSRPPFFGPLRCSCPDCHCLCHVRNADTFAACGCREITCLQLYIHFTLRQSLIRFHLCSILTPQASMC